VLPWIECPSLTFDLNCPVHERFADVPRDATEKGRRLLHAIMKEVPPRGRYLADLVRLRTRNRFHAEAVALARHIGGDWRSVMVANISYDLVLARFGCSAVALPTPAGPVLARNMDWWPQDILAQTSYVIRTHGGGQLRYAQAGWPGSIGIVTGLSGNGFAVALNAVLSPEGLDRRGYPVLLHVRRVLEDANGFDAAVRMLSEQRLVAPALFIVVGSENHQRVVIERTPRRHADRFPEGDRPLAVTNHYRQLYEPRTDRPDDDLTVTTSSRYDALLRLVGGHSSDRVIDDPALLFILSDPAVIQEITAQHVVIWPRAREIRLYVPRRLLDAGSNDTDA
jgi:hypothetical protein